MTELFEKGTNDTFNRCPSVDGAKARALVSIAISFKRLANVAERIYGLGEQEPKLAALTKRGH